MGAHHDFHITRVLHHWRSRAREAEELLREVAEEGIRISWDEDWDALVISEELADRINKHLERR
jgi:hypothetical protein